MQNLRTRIKCPGRVADILEACGALDPSSILGRDVSFLYVIYRHVHGPVACIAVVAIPSISGSAAGLTLVFDRKLVNVE